MLLRAGAQDAEIFKPDSIRKQIGAVGISTAIRVDGLLDEPEWLVAQAVSRFVQIEPMQGEAPRHETEVKVLYNRQYLYFGVFSRDSMGRSFTLVLTSRSKRSSVTQRVPLPGPDGSKRRQPDHAAAR